MSYNTTAYIIYILITTFITLVVGGKCHENGKVFMQTIFTDERIGDAVNNILLGAYYLLNIGYAILQVTKWQSVNTLTETLNELVINIGQIVLILAILHHVNIIALMVGRKIINKNKSEKLQTKN